MPTAERTGLIEKLTSVCEQAAAGTGIEIVEVQLKGGGKSRLLRIYIDKTGGVTHGDCELISERVGKVLDDDDVIPGDSYTLEVSSPGVERSLRSARDFERVIGQKIRAAFREPIGGRLRAEGRLTGISEGALQLETPDGEALRVPLDKVQKANLKFEW